ncbi:MAG TPA: hypothetical protein H9761_00900 [Candidatus Eisenbergiella merdavium]|uniref:Uncharacterized protein n=1 Tax=Candidatus Eisenbergiella merdavium TaxID=2838551 RepID=A0A9D2SP71_9FIRM|nr:hypothetical protein [Candidatus Eisenbergiella merdavium]
MDAVRDIKVRRPFFLCAVRRHFEGKDGWEKIRVTACLEIWIISKKEFRIIYEPKLDKFGKKG